MALKINKNLNNRTHQLLNGLHDTILNNDAINSFYIVVTPVIWEKPNIIFNTQCYVIFNDGDFDINNTFNIPLLSKQYVTESDIDSALNVAEQAYNYLKTLPEFEGAIDC